MFTLTNPAVLFPLSIYFPYPYPFSLQSLFPDPIFSLFPPIFSPHLSQESLRGCIFRFMLFNLRLVSFSYTLDRRRCICRDPDAGDRERRPWVATAPPHRSAGVIDVGYQLMVEAFVRSERAGGIFPLGSRLRPQVAERESSNLLNDFRVMGSG